MEIFLMILKWLFDYWANENEVSQMSLSFSLETLLLKKSLLPILNI